MEANMDVKRGPGRPRHEALKKGRSSWQPASVTDVVNKEDGYRYRLLNKDPDNLAKKQAEGWDIVVGNKDSAKLLDSGNLEHGAQMTSAFERRDVILARMPEEVALERDAYFDNKTARRTAGLTAHIKKEVAKEGAETHGGITISSRKGQQVIE